MLIIIKGPSIDTLFVVQLFKIYSSLRTAVGWGHRRRHHHQHDSLFLFATMATRSVVRDSRAGSRTSSYLTYMGWKSLWLAAGRVPGWQPDEFLLDGLLTRQRSQFREQPCLSRCRLTAAAHTLAGSLPAFRLVQLLLLLRLGLRLCLCLCL